MIKSKLIALALLVVTLLALLAGCNKTLEIDLNEVLEAVKEELGEDYIPVRPIDMEEIENFTGIAENLVKDYVAEGPMMSMHVDTFMAFRAEKGKGKDVAAKLNDYRTYLVEESLQYPMNMSKVEASKVVQEGDYVFFIMLGAFGNPEAEAGSKEANEFAQEEVARVEPVIEGFFKYYFLLFNLSRESKAFRFSGFFIPITKTFRPAKDLIGSMANIFRCR